MRVVPRLAGRQVSVAGGRTETGTTYLPVSVEISLRSEGNKNKTQNNKNKNKKQREETLLITGATPPPPGDANYVRSKLEHAHIVN